MIPPSEDVLFSIGRRDATTHGYLGHDDPSRIDDMSSVTIEGDRSDPAALPLLLTSDRSVHFEFDVAQGWDRPARLRLHTADQDSNSAPRVIATVNGQWFDGALRTGLGIQNEDPAHLAFPQTIAFDLPAATLKAGRNTLRVQISNASWFSWDSIDLTIRPRS